MRPKIERKETDLVYSFYKTVTVYVNWHVSLSDQMLLLVLTETF